MDRRCFLQAAGAVAAGIGLVGVGGRQLMAAESAAGAPNAEKLGWRLGCQAYSFNRFTFYDAVDKSKSLGLHCIEMYPGQKLSAAKPDARTDESLTPELRLEVKKYLADAGVKLVNYGVCGLPNDEAAARKTFEFAKDMGIETLVSEPNLDAFEVLDKLAGEYGINVALHNHPEPSRYWNPDTVLKVCEGRSKRIGACADTGHWMRSGINPLEAIKKLEGRIVSFHFKDLNKFGRQAHDVPWGTGKGDAEGMLREIRRQGIKAVFAIEYEYNWDNSVPEIAACVAYFDRMAAKLA
jgi:sugar phosphate isomerase/epimerase